jgi:hypothetical protein
MPRTTQELRVCVIGAGLICSCLVCVLLLTNVFRNRWVDLRPGTGQSGVREH